VFQPYDFKNPFNLANTDQKERRCKDFEVTYIKTDNNSFDKRPK
jgi:ATP-dependent Lon protease